LLLVVAVLSGCGDPDERIEAVAIEPRSFPAMESSVLILQSERGAIEIRGEEGRSTIDVTATIHAFGATLEQAERRLASLRLTRNQTPDSLYLGFESPIEAEAWDAPAYVEYAVVVPAETSLNAVLGDVDVTAEGLVGNVELVCDNGSVRLRRIEGGITVEARTGDVTLCETVGAVTIEAGSGLVTGLTLCGPLSVQTITGDVAIREATVDRLVVTAKKGNVTFDGELPGVDVEHGVWTDWGDISLRIPPDSRLQIEAVATGGIENAGLPLEGGTSGNVWSAVLNAPDSLLRLRAENGKIELEPVAADPPEGG
jgi:DUF4097 and DUF4098 domain-containing protein YvlB